MAVRPSALRSSRHGDKMAFNCPHCTKAIPDVLPKERIDEKNAQILALTNEVKETKRKAAAYDALEPQWQEAQTKLAELPTLAERLKAYETEKIDGIYTAAGVTNDKVRKLFQMEFDEQASTETGEKDLGKWIAATRALPADQRPVLLAPFLGGPAAPVPVPAAAPAARVNTLPPPTAPVVTPPAPSKMTAQQAAAAIAELTSKPLPADPAARAAAVTQRKADLAAIETAARGGVAT